LEDSCSLDRTEGKRIGPQERKKSFEVKKSSLGWKARGAEKQNTGSQKTHHAARPGGEKTLQTLNLVQKGVSSRHPYPRRGVVKQKRQESKKGKEESPESPGARPPAVEIHIFLLRRSDMTKKIRPGSRKEKVKKRGLEIKRI